MISTERSDLYEVSCLDCDITKLYFTAQGVGYFKLNHEGHRMTAEEPETGRIVEEGNMEVGRTPEIPEVLEASGEGEELRLEAHSLEAEGDRIKLSNLVVDAVDEEKERAVKVFGIAGGRERFSKEFGMHQLDELNGLLESGCYKDPSGMRYTWTPEKVDLSMDVVKMMEAPAAP